MRHNALLAFTFAAFLGTAFWLNSEVVEVERLTFEVQTLENAHNLLYNPSALQCAETHSKTGLFLALDKNRNEWQELAWKYIDEAENARANYNQCIYEFRLTLEE